MKCTGNTAALVSETWHMKLPCKDVNNRFDNRNYVTFLWRNVAAVEIPQARAYLNRN